MNIADLWAQIEEDQAWRLDEIRFFQNQPALIPNEEKHGQFRRALILLLYAHFEGFCKFALSLYVNTINGESLTCGEANHAIAAAALSDLFQALRDPSAKCPEFRSSLPEDTQLHRFARDREFILRVDDFAVKKVAIPDDYVDTESNLKPVVLRKNLYRLGFPHDIFQHLEGNIHRLLNYRNGISHGEFRAGIASREYEQLRDTVLSVMGEVKRIVIQAIQNKDYLKRASA